jgi:nucleoside-diphosphate-sugar epimerase
MEKKTEELLEESRVTIFGGAGYLGSVLTRQLLSEGWHVRVFDNFLFGSDGISDLDHPRLEVIEGDINDIPSASSAISGAGAVILLAAIPGRRVQDIEHRSMRNTNLLASSAVLDAAIEHGVDRFIFASSDTVYGVPSGVVYETTIPEPVSLYARLKLRMEERIINRRRKSFHPTVLRIATCHGLSPRMRFDLLPNRLLCAALTRGEIRVASEEQWRAFIHIDDAARAVLTCLKAHVNLVSGEIFNVVDKNQCLSNTQLVNTICTIAPECRVSFGGAAPDLINYRLSSSKIEKILDYSPRYSMEQSLREMKEAIESGIFGDTKRLKYHDY